MSDWIERPENGWELNAEGVPVGLINSDRVQIKTKNGSDSWVNIESYAFNIDWKYVDKYRVVEKDSPKPQPTIHELPRATLADISNVLRSIADEIEHGNFGKVEQAVLVIENSEGRIECFGAGAADFYRSIALLNLGINRIIKCKSGE